MRVSYSPKAYQKSQNARASFSGNNNVPKSHEQIKNEQLIKLYKEFQERPFKAAIINYYPNGEAKIKYIREKQTPSLIKRVIKKVLKLFRK